MTEPLQWELFRASLEPARGSEQAGERPVLVVSREAANRALPVVTTVPLTTARPGRRLFPGEVFLPKRVAGQPADSIVLAYQVRTISKDRLGKRIGRLEDEGIRDEVKGALRLHLDLE